MDAKADVCRRSCGSKRIAGSGGMAARSQSVARLAAHAIKDKAQSSMITTISRSEVSRADCDAFWKVGCALRKLPAQLGGRPHKHPQRDG